MSLQIVFLPEIQTRQELLAQHGIDYFPVTDDDADHFPAVFVEQPRINLSHQQQQNIKQATETNSDTTAKYQTCCRETHYKMAEIHNL